MGVRYRFGDYILDVAAHELSRSGALVTQPARVFESLVCLIERRDRAVARDELLEAVFGRIDVSDAQLAQVIVRARRAIGDDGQEQRAIRTVPRFGFRWVAATEVLDGRAGVISGGIVTDDRGHGPSAIRAPVFAAGSAIDDTVAADVATTSASAASSSGPNSSATSGDPELRRHPTLRHGHAPTRSSSSRVGTRRWPSIAALTLVLLAAAAWWSQRTAMPASTSATRAAPTLRAVAVLPLDVDARADASWARLGLMDFIGDRLRRSGLPVPASETVIGLLRAQRGPPTSDDADGEADTVRAAAPAEATRLRAAMRVAWVASGRATRTADGWTVALLARHADGTEQRGAGRDADLLQAAKLATDRLAIALGGRIPADEADLPGLAERLQRARVAMLANELEAARRILLDAPELQRQKPQLRYQLARIDFRAGAFTQGLARLDGVLASDDVARDPIFHAQVLNARGAMLLRLDRTREAIDTYDRAIALAGDGRHPTELGVAYSGRGVAHAMRQDYDGAVADLSQARVQFDSAGDALAVARVDGNLGTLEADRGRPAYGLPYLTQAVDALATLGAINELATVRNARTAIHLQLLQHAAATADSDRAWALMPRLRDPAQRADVVLTRAAVMLATGRLAEAGRLLAGPDAAQALASEHGKRELLQVDLAIAGGTPARAVAIADAALSTWPVDSNPRGRAWLEATRDQAALDGELAVSQSAVEPTDDSVASQLALAARERARGDDAATERAFSGALALAERRGIPSEVAAVAAPRVAWLIERGRSAEAAALLGRLAPWAGEDFDLALLQLRVARAVGPRDRWQAAWDRANTLAGERRVPAELAPPTG